MVVEDLHSGEQVLEVIRDELLERQEAHRLAVVGELHEAGEHRRHLEARELLATRPRVADADGEVEREPRDVREWVCRVHCEGHQHGEDLGVEVVVQLASVVLVDVGPRHDLDAGLREGGPHQRGPGVRVPQLQRVRLGGDVGRAPPVGSGPRSSARRGP